MVLNLINSTQDVYITPEEDMLIKVSAKEAYGINMAMSICQGSSCDVKSSKVGNTEMIFAVLKARKEYRLNLDYSHSIIELSTFYDCPHARFSLSMMKVDEAEKVIKDQESKDKGTWLETELKNSNEALASAFKLISESAQMDESAFLLSGQDSVYRFSAFSRQSSQQTSMVLTRG